MEISQVAQWFLVKIFCCHLQRPVLFPFRFFKKGKQSMFCPKCSDVELESVKQEKLEYLACVNSCEGAWVSREDLEKGWGKKKCKTMESQLVENKQPQFQEQSVDSKDLTPGAGAEPIFNEEELSHFEPPLEAEAEEEEEEVSVDDFDDDEASLEDEEVEEVHFGEQRDRAIVLISDDSEFEESASGSETTEGFNDSADLLDEEEEDGMQGAEEENFFWTSPASGNPMKRFSLNIKDKFKCSVGFCPDSDHYWVDGNEELLSYLMEAQKTTAKSFADLLAYDRPEVEIVVEDEDEDDY
jgi:Zn-finger nucleic acid-binding protein